MIWFLLAFLSAFFDSMKDITSKKILKNVEPTIVALAQTAFAVPIFLFLTLVFEHPAFDDVFWIIVILHGITIGFAFLVYMKSLKTTDISLSIPFTALSPVFMLFVTPLLIGESTTNAGSLGVLLIAAGVYVLNAGKASRGVLEPLRALLRDRGVRLMIFVAFLWSVTATIDRLALRHSTPLFYITIDYFFASVFLYLNHLRTKTSLLGATKKYIRTLASVGIFFALSQIAYIYAYKLTLAAYAISIKRTSVLFTVILGGFVFKEKNIRERFLGAALIVIGVAIILVF